ncbi:hypothetical protein PIROE2DRAFT_17898 [Piromyces sp. E2]|nr:hypothetical protein PIROE2DRAFT_17898 [Piromyces sp. E2]|eukprot:OUM57186.1 hypothetical protein PIROE2DRAFT_17898 [Piromyces sp. E2]
MKVFSFTILFVLLCALNVNAFNLIDFISDIFGGSGSSKEVKTTYESNVVKDIKFGGSSAGYLDVYYDKANVKTLKPVVIFLHGGAWVSGNKSDYVNNGKFLSEDGYVAVLSNYILFPKGKVEEMVNDVYQTIQWTYNNIKNYGGDRSKITLVGYSAGAHLAALTTIKAALRMENNDKYLQPLPKLEKVVLFNPPLDFDDYDAVLKIFGIKGNSSLGEGLVKSIVRLLLDSDDVGPTDILENLRSNSVSDFGFPTITIFHGGKDQLIPAVSVDNFIKNIKRVSPKIKVNDVYQATFDHGTLLDGSAKNDKTMKQMFLDIIKM